MYLSAIGADDKSAETKASVFLHVAGGEELDVYHNFQSEAQDNKMRLDKILEKFEAYCILKRNVTFERHRFFTCFDQHVTKLKNRSKMCKFGGLIKGRLGCGIPDNSLRGRLLREKGLDLEKVINICRAAEMVKTQAKELFSESCNVDAVTSNGHGAGNIKSADVKKEMKSVDRDVQGNTCGRCGPQHLP